MIKKCIICGCAFETGRSDRITCSPECRKVREANKNKERYAEKCKAKQPATIECLVCGKEVKRTNPRQKYCGPDCKKIAAKENKTIKEDSTKLSNKKIICKSKDEKQAKERRIKSQISISKNGAVARKLGMSYGEYKGMKYMKKNGSVLDQPWAQELLKNQSSSDK